MKRQITWDDFVWLKYSPISQADKSQILGLTDSYVNNLIVGISRKEWQAELSVFSQANVKLTMDSWIPKEIYNKKKHKPKNRIEIRDIIYIRRSPLPIQKIKQLFNVSERVIVDLIAGRRSQPQISIISKMQPDEIARLMSVYELKPIKGNKAAPRKAKLYESKTQERAKTEIKNKWQWFRLIK